LDGVYFGGEGGAEGGELGDHLVYGVVCGGVLVGDVDEHELVASCEAGLALDDCVLEVVVDEEFGGGVCDEVLVAVVVEVSFEEVCGVSSEAGAVCFGEVAGGVSEVIAEVCAGGHDDGDVWDGVVVEICELEVDCGCGDWGGDLWCEGWVFWGACVDEGVDDSRGAGGYEDVGEVVVVDVGGADFYWVA